MRFYEEQQMQMLGSVTGGLKKDKEILAVRVPALGDLINDFVARYDELNRLCYTRKNIVTVSTRQKKTIREGLVDMLMIISGMLHAHHHKHEPKKNDEAEDGSTLKPGTSFHYTISELSRMSAEKLCSVTESVIVAAKKVKHVTRYGITHEDIKDTETYYKEFVASKERPRLGKKEVASRNERISREIKECISMLDNKIDPLMRIAARDNNAIGDDYKQRRKVLGKGLGRPSDKEVKYRKSRKRKKKVMVI